MSYQDQYGNSDRQTDEFGNPAGQTDRYGNPDRQTDEFGNPVGQTDRYGNPVHHAGGTGAYGTTHPSGTTVPLTGSGYGESQQQMHRQTDEFGNPIGQTDEFGNPVHHAGGTGAYGTTHPSGTTVPLTGSGYGESQRQMHRQTDEFGNPVGQTDQYGNPVHHAGGTGAYGTIHPFGTTVPLTGYGESQQQMHRQTDEFGNPVGQTDQYGNPVHHAGGTGVYGTTHPSGTTVPLTGSGYGESQQQMHRQEHHGLSGTLQRSGSSSSSEDDEYGGRRKKKGLTEKIKEKIPCVGHKEHQTDEF